jgi:uncharacterized membrane protein YeiH
MAVIGVRAESVTAGGCLTMFEFGMQIAFDLLGMFAFATSGALMAIRKDFDAIGILLLAELTATGGGVMRDLIIGATPPAAFTNLWYLVVRSSQQSLRSSPTRSLSA